MATNDGGTGPTDLSGVTYLGRPSDESKQSYHIKRTSGKVLGPFDADLIVQMIRGEKLSGDEGVSQDQVAWVPIMAVPSFAEAFRLRSPADAGNTLFGVKAVPDGPGAPVPAAPGDEPTLLTSKDELGAPDFAEPLSVDDLEPTENSTMSMASESWSSLGEPTETSMSGLAMPGADALGEVSGVRALSTQSTPAAGSGEDGEPVSSTVELPTPEGFTNFPAADGNASPFSSMGSAEGAAGASAWDAAPDAAESGAEAQDFGGAPGAVSGGGTVEFGGFAGVASGGGTMAMSGLQIPEPPSEGVEDLPTRKPDDLPVSAETNLPVSASAGEGGSLDDWMGTPSTTNLPTPAGAPGLPTHGESLMNANEGGHFGTMAMSGIDVGADLPASREQFDLGALADEAEGGVELPASARGAGTSVLDDMAEADDIWAAPEPRTSPMEPTAARGDAGMNFATEEIGFELDPSEAQGAAGEALSSSGAFDDFFPSDGGHNTTMRVSEGPAPAMPEPEPSTVPLESAPTPAAAPRPRSKGGALKAVGALLVLAVLGGGGYFAATKLMGSEPEPVPEPEPVVAVAPVVAPDVPPLSDLYAGNYDDYVLYVGDARTAVEQRQDPDERAKLVVASALLLAEHPASEAMLEDLQSQAQSLEGVDEPSDLVRLGQGAYLAVSGDATAAEALSGLRRGEYAGLAHLFTGLAAVQAYRGIAPEPEPEPEAAVAEGSGAADEGSGAAEAEAEAAEVEVAPEDVSQEPASLDAEVLSHFLASAQAQPDLVSAHYWQGWTALNLGDPSGAEASFSAALERNERHVSSMVGVARALLLQGRLGDADGRIQQVIDSMEGTSSAEARADAFVAAAEVSIARLQPQLAIESLLSALQADPTNERALGMLGDQFYRAGQYQRAIEYFETNEDLSEDNAEAAVGLARSRIGLQQHEEAIAGLEAAMQEDSRDARFPYLLGQAYEREAEFELARQYYRQALQIEPTFTRPLVALARLAQRENMPGEAVELLERAAAANSADAATANEIGEMYLSLGDTNRAVTAFRRSLELDQSQPFARINLTEFYLDSGQQARAIEYINEMLEAGIESPQVRFLNARALEGQGQYAQGIELVLALIEEEPENAEYRFMNGLLHFGAGEYETAKASFQTAFDGAPAMHEALYYVGRCELALGNHNDAITALTTASRRSARGLYYYWLGVSLEEGSQGAQAMMSYTQCIDDDIAWSLENPDVFYRRGALYYGRGLQGASYRDMRTALTLMPDSAPASKVLGQVYFDNRSYPAAIAAFQRSLALEAAQPDVHYSIALASLRMEDTELGVARTHLEQARDGDYGTQHPDLYRRLAYVYRDLGERDLAVEMLEEYLDKATLAEDEERETENEIARLGGRR